VREIGRALARSGASAARLRSRSGATPAVGPELAAALTEGLLARAPTSSTSACATPVAYFAPTTWLRQLRRHHRQPHPPDYNGLKMVIAGGTCGAKTCRAAPRIEARELSGEMASAAPPTSSCLCRAHRERREAGAPFSHRVDCGNGVAACSRRALPAAGLRGGELYFEVDGPFRTTIPILRNPRIFRS